MVSSYYFRLSSVKLFRVTLLINDLIIVVENYSVVSINAALVHKFQKSFSKKCYGEL